MIDDYFFPLGLFSNYFGSFKFNCMRIMKGAVFMVILILSTILIIPLLLLILEGTCEGEDSLLFKMYKEI